VCGADWPGVFAAIQYSLELNAVEYLHNDVKGNSRRSGRARDRDDWKGKVRLYLRQTQGYKAIVQAYFRAKPVKYAA
jgi:hypothetical protein